MGTVPLGEVATIDRVAASEQECLTLPYVGLEHIEKDAGNFADGYRPKPETLLATKFKFSSRHILYGKLRPYLNKVALPTFAGVCTTEILPILPKPGKLERGYLYAILMSPRFVKWASENVSGANLPRLDPKRLAEFEIPLRPLPEQQRIAGILEQADRLRRLRRYALELGDGLLQATFLDLFGHPSLNPMKWPTARLGDITENLDSRRIPVEASERSLRKGKYAYYGASGIIDYVQDFIFDEEALLVGEDGANLIARATPIAFVATGKYWVNNHAHVLRMTEKVNLRFLETFFSLTDLEPLVTGTAQPKLTAGKLNEIPVIIPPMALQKKFADIEAKSTGLRKVHRESLRQAEHLFQTLLHRAFTTGL